MKKFIIMIMALVATVTMSAQHVAESKAFDNTYVKDFEIFIGWATEENGELVYSEYGITIFEMPADNVTLYAVFGIAGGLYNGTTLVRSWDSLIANNNLLISNNTLQSLNLSNISAAYNSFHVKYGIETLAGNALSNLTNITTFVLPESLPRMFGLYSDTCSGKRF